MTPPSITYLPQSKAELTFIVSPEDAKPYLEQAVTDISTQKPLKGFRPGKATYDDLKRAYGEMLIWETALERIVRAHFVKAVMEEKLETIGSPEIAVQQLVPHQPIRFTVAVSLMPQITTLADYSQPIVEQRQKEITTDVIQKGLEDLRKMRRVETAVDRAATTQDLVVIDLQIAQNNVIIEGGSSLNYRIYLDEPHYIPGFTEQLVGLKKGDSKTFELDFPKDHYNKQLAGKPTQFTATVKEVYELQLPELTDTFAATLGQPSLDALTTLLRSNLEHEEEHRAQEAAEIELLEKLVKNSTFSDIPDLLVNEEVRKMIRELERSAEEQGMQMEDYLTSIKKTTDDLRLDFVPRALERIQTALLIREIAKIEHCTVGDAEVDAEQDRLLAGIKSTDTQTREVVSSVEYRDYIASRLRNEKVLEILRTKGVKGYRVHNDEK